jgi:IMP cyclohydrolase
MKNPISPYPGRQLFVGLTSEGNACFIYLVTGRSPESRARKATLTGNKVIIGPLGNTEYDPLRHYTAVQFDNTNGVTAISNGIQTEAIFETFRLLYNVNSPPTKDFLEKIMEGAQAEPDSLHTPRIGSIITGNLEIGPVSYISIKRQDRPADAFQVHQKRGTLTGISTYNGALENPESFDPTSGLPTLEITATSPDGIAKYLFEISSANNKGQDIRVCTVGGVRFAKGWTVSIVNAN